MEPPPKILRNIAADSSVALIFKVLAIPIAFLTSLVMARLYGAEQMGTYCLAIYLVMTLAVFCRLGLDTGLLRFTAALKAQGQGADLQRLFGPALGLVLLLSGVAAVGLYGSGDWLAQRFHAPHLSLILGLVALALPISVATSMVGETVRALGGVRWVVFQHSLLSPLTILVLVIILAWAGQNFIGPSRALGLAFLSSALVGLVFLVVGLGSYVRRHESRPGPGSVKKLLLYSWPLYLSSIMMLAFGTLDSLILGLFTSPAQVAYYEAATKTALLITIPLLAVNATVPPLFAQFHQRGDLPGLELVAQTTARWMYYVALPLSVLIILLAPHILRFLGPDFVQARFALSALALGQLVNVGCGSVGFILMMTGNQWWVTAMQVITGAITIPLMALAAAKYGLNGLAVARSLWVLGLNLLMTLALWRQLRIKAFAPRFHQANFGGLLGVGLFFLTEPLLGPVGGAIFFAVGYLALVAKSLRQELAQLLY